MRGNLVDRRVQLGVEPRHEQLHHVKISVEDVSFWYGDNQALKNISLQLFDREVSAFIGASGSGKSTLLRCFNRMNETIPNTRMTGRILLEGEDIYGAEVDPPMLRKRFGWVAQKPNPFPVSVRRNVLYGARLHGIVSNRVEAADLVERCLRQAGLWEEVKDRLEESAMGLSGGQQQRLCIARALAHEPDTILMDEPCSALDPHATAHIEQLIEELRSQYAIIIVTHNMQQAARVSQRTAFFHLGTLVEFGDTEQIFTRPRTTQCMNYITGRYG
jgi:phosphate transport system ATP-binding protein